jgi:hypothetical protein
MLLLALQMVRLFGTCGVVVKVSDILYIECLHLFPCGY